MRALSRAPLADNTSPILLWPTTRSRCQLRFFGSLVGQPLTYTQTLLKFHHCLIQLLLSHEGLTDLRVGHSKIALPTQVA